MLASLLGIPDPGVWLAYILSILSAALCVAYGLANWHRGDDSEQIEDRKWAANQQQIEQEM
jgi:hypothetical protein